MVPSACADSTSRSMTCSPVSESNDPVGSSANSTRGFVISPRGQRDALRLAAGQFPGAALTEPVQTESVAATAGLPATLVPAGSR